MTPISAQTERSSPLVAPAAASPRPAADILIVDDTVNNLRLLASILTQAGYPVRKALSGELALNSVALRLPDLILLDVTMPGLSGYEVCQRLKQNPATAAIPVLFISALDQPLDKVKAFEVGGVDYITKPFQNEEVLARIQHHLTIQQLQKDLAARNQALEQALAELQSTQAELIQQKKMLSLSSLVAGVAHEINNPLSFIQGNIPLARRYVGDLFQLLALYQAKQQEPEAEIVALLDELDLEFLQTDLVSLFQSLEVGATRIAAIVKALSHLHDPRAAEQQQLNLPESFQQLLVLLQHRLQAQGDRPAIQVLQVHDPLPPIVGSERLLNQVWLHLLTNAIDAIDERWQTGEPPTESPTIWVQTGLLTAEMVAIALRDNGSGMTAAVRDRIYDPFFTTKPQGKGAGLGLTTAYQTITTLHQGLITCQSEPGQGTEITVQLPLGRYSD